MIWFKSLFRRDPLFIKNLPAGQYLYYHQIHHDFGDMENIPGLVYLPSAPLEDQLGILADTTSLSEHKRLGHEQNSLEAETYLAPKASDIRPFRNTLATTSSSARDSDGFCGTKDLDFWTYRDTTRFYSWLIELDISQSNIDWLNNAQA